MAIPTLPPPGWSLSRLRHLIAVVEDQSLGKAADRIALSRLARTRWIQSLEARPTAARRPSPETDPWTMFASAAPA
jgi:hypothetical protein